MLGTPGGARVGAPLAAEVVLSKATLAGVNGLASIPERGLMALGIGVELRATSITDGLMTFEIAALNVAGTAGVLYQADCRCLQFIAGLPSEPRVLRTLAIDVEGDVRALALNEDASAVAVATVIAGEQPAGKVYLIRGEDRQLLADARTPGIAFAPESGRLVWIDSGRQAVVVRNAETGETVDVEGEGGFWSDLSAAGFVGPGKLAVGTKDGLITLIDLAGGERKTLECACRPELFAPMLAKGMYRVTSLVSGSVWVLADGEPQPRTFFVPVDDAGDRQ